MILLHSWNLYYFSTALKVTSAVCLGEMHEDDVVNVVVVVVAGRINW